MASKASDEYGGDENDEMVIQKLRELTDSKNATIDSEISILQEKLEKIRKILHPIPTQKREVDLLNIRRLWN